MSFRIEDPAWLWLLAAALPLTLVAIYAFTAMNRLRRWSAIAARLLLLAVLAVALAGASSIRRTDKAALVIAVDTSGSVRAFVPSPSSPSPPPPGTQQADPAPILDALRERLNGAINRDAAKLGPDDTVTLLTFDGVSRTLAAPFHPTGPRSGPLGVNGGDRRFLPSPLEGSDLAAAIRAAAASVPTDTQGRILIISDGLAQPTLAVATDGTAEPPAAQVIAAARNAFAATKTPIDVLPLTFVDPREVIVESLDAPTRVASDRAPVPLTLTITSINAAPVTGQLHLTQEGQTVPLPPEAATITLQPGRNVLTLRVPLSPGRLHRFEASFEPSTPGPGEAPVDTVTANNRAVAFTTSPGAGRVLLVDGTERLPSAAAPLSTLLNSAGVNTSVVTASAFDTAGDLLSLQAYDLIALIDAPADALSPATQQNLARYVADTGGGLLMVGGPPPSANSFGAGGWKGTPIEPILPVTLDLPDRLVMPSTAVVIILDSSGSMGRSVMGSAASQQEIADRGAAAALGALDKQDLVGVIEFNSTSSWVVHLRPNDDPASTADKIMGISPGGGTNLPPALEMAYAALQPARAAVKHVIVLSDGQSQGRGRLAAIEKKFREAPGGPIKISSIAVGDDADTSSLRSLAIGAGGEFFKVVDPAILPRIFIKAVRVVRTPLIREEPFTPAITASGSPATAGIRTLPPLGGIILTQPRLDEQKKNVQGVTYALLTPQGEPLLAHWRVGLGQVGAFTSSPLGSGWATAWSTPPAQALWTQLARTLSRGGGGGAGGGGEGQPDLAARLDGDTVRIRVDAPGVPPTAPPPKVTLYDPHGVRRDVTPSLTAPGVYEAALPSGDGGEGVYVITVAPGTPGMAPVIGGVVKASPAAAEYRVPRGGTSAAGTDLLRQIARETGGRVLTLSDLTTLNAPTLFNRDKVEPRESRSPLWPTLVLAAGGVLLLDIATRRIAWDRAFGSEAHESRKSRSAEHRSASFSPGSEAHESRKSRSAEHRTASSSPSAPGASESPDPDSPPPSPLAAAKRRARQQTDRR